MISKSPKFDRINDQKMTENTLNKTKLGVISRHFVHVDVSLIFKCMLAYYYYILLLL